MGKNAHFQIKFYSSKTKNEIRKKLSSHSFVVQRISLRLHKGVSTRYVFYSVLVCAVLKRCKSWASTRHHVRTLLAQFSVILPWRRYKSKYHRAGLYISCSPAPDQIEVFTLDNSLRKTDLRGINFLNNCFSACLHVNLFVFFN